MSDKTERFHAHLDKCERCRNEPMNLCAFGASLLASAATDTLILARQHPECATVLFKEKP